MAEMFPGNDSLPTAVLTAEELDLKPLVEQSAEELDLDCRQASAMASHLHQAWFLGIRTGHKVMVETKMGQSDATPVVLTMQDEFRALMEGCADALDLTLLATIAAWNYLARAWVAGAEFWKVEIAARLIESKAGGFEEFLRRLEK